MNDITFNIWSTCAAEIADPKEMTQITFMQPTISPRELAAAIGTSESSIKRWVDDGLIEATRTDGGHRRITLQEAIRFVRRDGCRLVNPGLLGFPEVQDVELGREDESGRFFDFLNRGDARRARGYLLALYLRGVSLANICDGPVHEAMSTVGELWLKDPSGVFLEHRATDTCIHAISRLRQVFDVPESSPIALGGAPAGDPYVIPSLAVATVLSSEDCHAVNLGPDVPFDSFLIAVREIRPLFVWLCVSSIELPRDFAKQLRQFAEQLSDFGVQLMVGGRTSDQAVRLCEPGLVHRGKTMAELVAFFKGLNASRLQHKAI